MALAAGTKLGSYEVHAQIGAGGMGEVYQAHDTRLDRIVAIKVLPTHLADRSELRERFEREARTGSIVCVAHYCGHLFVDVTREFLEIAFISEDSSAPVPGIRPRRLSIFLAVCSDCVRSPAGLPPAPV
jgi:hypothetical protein